MVVVGHFMLVLLRFTGKLSKVEGSRSAGLSYVLFATVSPRFLSSCADAILGDEMSLA